MRRCSRTCGCSDSSEFGSRRRAVTSGAVERPQHVRRAPHDVDRLPAPVHLEDGAGLQLRDVLFDRRAERLRSRARLPGRQERHGGQSCTGDAGHGRCDQQEMSSARRRSALLRSSTLSALGLLARAQALFRNPSTRCLCAARGVHRRERQAPRELHGSTRSFKHSRNSALYTHHSRRFEAPVDDAHHGRVECSNGHALHASWRRCDTH